MDEINVLVIEDKKEDASFLEDVLRRQGYKVWVCSQASEGLALIKDNTFAAVVTELLLPDMGGAEFSREALLLRENIGVVVITVRGFIDTAVEAMKEGAYGYITKPFNTDEVQIVVKRAIERFFLFSSDKEKEEFAELSIKDGLTGLYNRRFLKVYLQNQITLMKRSAGKFSLLMIDIDYFKKYNDTNGHLAGDELLRDVSGLLQESLRQGDAVFRYGGEEFIIYLDNTDKKGASLVAERTRNSVNLFSPVTVSIGVGTFTEDGSRMDELISKVDAALYKAKESGRNKVCLV